MAEGHFHGATGAQIVGNRDLTRHSNQMGFQVQMDTAEDTGMQSFGRAKTFLSGLRGVSASSSTFLVNDAAWIAAETKHVAGTSTDLELLTLAWAGFTAGNMVTLAQAFKTTHNIPQTNSSAVLATVNHQCSGPYYFGTALWDPFGGDIYSVDEIQGLVFSSVNENIFLGLRATGQTEVFAFQLSSYADNAAIKAGLKAGIEALAAYTGITVTITGTLTKTGSAWSGTYTLVFDSDADVPQLQARQGRVDRFQVTSGDGDSDYSANGGATFALGISQSTFQTNQRALSGQFGGVVCKGSSTAPTGGPDFNQFTGGTINLGANSFQGGGSLASLHDGLTTGGYLDMGGSSEFATIDLGSLKTLDTVRIFADANNCDFKFSSSGAFTGEEVVVTLDFGDDGISRWEEDTFARGSYRYLRIQQSSGSNSALHIYEIELTDSLAEVTGGTADFSSYYPLSATPASPTATGTGASNATVTAAGAAAGVTPSTSVDGSSPSQQGGAMWSLITTTGAGDWYDQGAQTTTGFYSRFQALLASGTITVDIEHNSSASDVGVATLCSFEVTDVNDIDQLVQEYIAANNTTVKRYVRAKVSAVSGTFAVAVCYANYSFEPA